MKESMRKEYLANLEKLEIEEVEIEQQRKEAYDAKVRNYQAIHENPVIKKVKNGWYEVNDIEVMDVNSEEEALQSVLAGEDLDLADKPAPIPHAILEFKALSLSDRAATCVYQAGFRSADEFEKAKEEDFAMEKKIKNMGSETRDEIIAVLREVQRV